MFCFVVLGGQGAAGMRAAASIVLGREDGLRHHKGLVVQVVVHKVSVLEVLMRKEGLRMQRV